MSEKIITLKPTENDAGLRVDLFLSASSLGISRSQLTQWIKSGKVSVNGSVIKPSFKLHSQDEIKIVFPEIISSTIQGEEIALDVLYEDEDILVINKPPGMVVHPAAGHFKGTLVNALLGGKYKKLSSIGGIHRPGLVHRLDKGTSGVILIARNDQAHVHISNQFKKHSVEKKYRALIFGCPKNKEGKMETFLTRSDRDRKKMMSHLKKGKKAITNWKVLRSMGGISEIAINIETGRTHQIRVHLSELGHSILGDLVYGSLRRCLQIKNLKIRKKIQELSHPMLHAETLSLIHPRSQKKISFVAPFPEDMKLLQKEVSK